MVVPYYSRRHVVRLVDSDERLDARLSHMNSNFDSGTPLLLALRPGDAERFPRALAKYPVVALEDDLIVFDLGTATGSH